MTYQERRTLVMMITSLATTLIYALIMYNRYNSGQLSDENIMKFWAIIILLFIPVTVVSQIVTQIIYHIIEAIGIEIKGGDHDELGVSDERDKLIELKASKVSQAIFLSGFFVGLLTQLFDYTAHAFFLSLIISGILSLILEESCKLVLYRKGV